MKKPINKLLLLGFGLSLAITGCLNNTESDGTNEVDNDTYRENVFLFDDTDTDANTLAKN